MRAIICLLFLLSVNLVAQTVSIDQNKLKYEGSVQFSGATQIFTTVAGKSYTLMWDLDFVSGSSAHGIKVEAFDGANSTPFATSSLYTTSIAGSLDFTASSTATKIKFSSQAPTGTSMIYYLDGVLLREKIPTDWSLTGAGTLSRSSGILTCSNPGTDEGVKRMYPTIPGHEYELKVNFLNGDYDVQLKSKAFNGSWHSEESIFFGEQEVTYTFIAQSEQSEIHLLFLRGATNYQYKVDEVRLTNKDEINFVADVSQYGLHYPFGMQQPAMVSTSDYRYSFQGQEGDEEVKGEGNSVNYKYRMHDPRIGRFFAIDPLTPKYPELTPYQFSSNNPIGMREIEGLEGEPVSKGDVIKIRGEGVLEVVDIQYFPHGDKNGTTMGVQIEFKFKSKDGSTKSRDESRYRWVQTVRTNEDIDSRMTVYHTEPGKEVEFMDISDRHAESGMIEYDEEGMVLVDILGRNGNDDYEVSWQAETSLVKLDKDGNVKERLITLTWGFNIGKGEMAEEGNGLERIDEPSAFHLEMLEQNPVDEPKREVKK